MRPPKLKIDRARTVLLLVDVQPDFMPGGALAVAGGDRIVEPLRKLMAAGVFDHYVATQDWHPPGHISFASRHPGRAPFDTIDLYGHEQVLWPDHCIQGSKGAELHSGLSWEKVSLILRKGEDPAVDSYSGFRNNWDPDGKRPSTGLAGYLRERGVHEIHVCGLARDVCVKWTAQDAVEAGFDVYLLWDLTRAVDPATDDEVRGDLEGRGVRVVDSTQLAA